MSESFISIYNLYSDTTLWHTSNDACIWLSIMYTFDKLYVTL